MKEDFIETAKSVMDYEHIYNVVYFNRHYPDLGFISLCAVLKSSNVNEYGMYETFSVIDYVSFNRNEYAREIEGITFTIG